MAPHRPRSLLQHARALDAADELAGFRREFAIPRVDGRTVTYLCGHSLGLMPHRARAALEAELERWSTQGVAGHFDSDGWLTYHQRFAPPLGRLAGARPSEVVAMNSLTVNLHLMLASFFKPSRRRHKILIEHDAFSSDRYAVESQLRWHGLDPAHASIRLGPRDPARGLTVDDLSAALKRERGRVALVWLPGVQYLTGQVLDMRALTAAAHRHGALIGFDLAHAIGNVPLALHRWEADFAVWCSYKYLNGGPGAIGGCFVHDRHGKDSLPRLAGWWGHDPMQRFAADTPYAPLRGAEGWQLSNPPIFAMAPLAVSLEIFGAAGAARLRRKSQRLTAFMHAAIRKLVPQVRIVTPPRPGAQLSLALAEGPSAQSIERALGAERVIVDAREPDVLRLAPVPLYNRFEDVARAVLALRRAIK